MTLSVSHPRAKQRWSLLVVAVVGVMLAFATMAQGLTQTEFELDKNATNDLTTVHQGSLKGSVSNSALTIDVCQLATAPAPPFTILIDAEQMSVTAVNTLPGNGSTKLGGCSFTNPADVPINVMRYTVTRGIDDVTTPEVDPTTAASHPGASDVTILVTGAVAGDDWDDVYDSVQEDISNGITENHQCTDLGAVACVWAHDDFNLTVFTTGGSKDDLNINPVPPEPGTGWKWTNSSVPPSDEILDAFAVKYDTGTRQLLFFGADRWSTNGAKDMGFWLFHDQVGLNPDGTFSGNHTRPTNPDGIPNNGDETRGDILLLSTFTQGGAVTTIRVFEWVGAGGNTNGTLNSLGAFGDCVPGNAADNGCNTVSNTTVPSPWPYQGAGSTQVPGVIYTGGLAEGGIDLTALNLEGCFASFMAETRSSPEPGAQLKDFALGNFESCGATITTDASDDEFDIGGSITDNATVNVTGGGPAPTGFVDFYVCGPEDGITSCDASGTFVSSEDLAGATGTPPDYTVTSDSFTPTSAGDYCFYAEYPAGQDANYPDGAFLTDFTDECFTVTPAQPNIVTNATDGPVALGSSLDDVATLSGTANQPDGDPAGGTITFTAYGPHDDLTTCTTVAYTSVVAVSGDGAYTASSGTGGTLTPTAAGTYNWIAVYSGDLPNTLGDTTACGDADEGTVISPVQPTIVTNATDGPVPLGSSLDDVATLSGTANQPDGDPAGGTITFTAYGPHDDLTTCDTVAYTSVVNVSGDGNYTASTGTGGIFTPSEAGTYNWIAVYSGDPPNTLGAAGTCGEADEGTVVISLQPTMDTAQNFVPNDSATITVGDGNGDLQGNVVFQLFVNDEDCSGDPAYESDPIDITSGSGSGQSRTVVSDNETAYDVDGTTFSWVVTFDSTKLGHEDVSSPCGNETSSITIDNGAQQPPPILLSGR